MEAKRTRTRRGLHYQIERLPLPLLLPLLLLLQSCFRFRLQCPSEIVEEAAEIQEFGPSLDIKLSTWQAIKRQQSKPSAEAEAEAFSMISFGFPILRIPIGQAAPRRGPQLCLENPSNLPRDFWGHKLLIDTEFNQHERRGCPPPFSLFLSLCIYIFIFAASPLRLHLLIFLIYASPYNSAWFITEIGKRFCLAALQLVAYRQQQYKEWMKKEKIIKKVQQQQQVGHTIYR